MSGGRHGKSVAYLETGVEYLNRGICVCVAVGTEIAFASVYSIQSSPVLLLADKLQAE